MKTDMMKVRDTLLLPVGEDIAQLCVDLIVARNAKVIVELGSSYGYSTLYLAEAARRTGGKLLSYEIHPDKQQHARERITRRIGALDRPRSNVLHDLRVRDEPSARLPGEELEGFCRVVRREVKIGFGGVLRSQHAHQQYANGRKPEPAQEGRKDCGEAGGWISQDLHSRDKTNQARRLITPERTFFEIIPVRRSGAHPGPPERSPVSP